MKFRKPAQLKGKTFRRPYSKSKRFDASCRNHGSCGWCEGNRTFFDRKRRVAAEIDIKDYLEYASTNCKSG
jgi:hypothetical protein